MNNVMIRRGMGLALSLTLALAAIPAAARAAEKTGLCIHHTAHNDLCGHSQEQDCSFGKDGCKLCKDGIGLVTIVGTDVTIDGYSFPYTGKEIRPDITVTVKDTQLTQDTHYTLTYENNVDPGTGRVTVTGITEAGFDGIVTIEFTIEKPSYTLVELKGTDVTMDGTEFDYTGKAIEPAVTVTVEGKTLTRDKDYSVSYSNNVEPGTASVTVKGIATASQTLGYTGEVTIPFTIRETQPEESKPEESKPEESKPVEYKFTKGSGATWYMGSGKNLTFTLSGKGADITEIRVKDKALSSSDYTVSGSSITLNKSFLNKLSVGKYAITVQFRDGKAEGTFLVSNQLDTTNPATGDTANPGLWFTAAAGSLAALAFLFSKKRTRG